MLSLQQELCVDCNLLQNIKTSLKFNNLLGHRVIVSKR